MNTILIFVWIWAAMIALSFVEATVEGRNPWGKRKVGWVIKIRKNITLPEYHFFLFFIMLPLFFTLPLVVYGWNTRLFGILVSAFFSGIVLEDFFWYMVNPVVKFKEFWSSITDFYPWIKINNKKIIPVGYILGIAIALASWYFLWRI